MNCYHAA
jgi:hypothetical protein